MKINYVLLFLATIFVRHNIAAPVDEGQEQEEFVFVFPGAQPGNNVYRQQPQTGSSFKVPFSLNLVPPPRPISKNNNPQPSPGAGEVNPTHDSYGNPVEIDVKTDVNQNEPAILEPQQKVVTSDGLAFVIPSYASGITGIKPPSDDLLPPLETELSTYEENPADDPSSAVDTKDVTANEIFGAPKTEPDHPKVTNAHIGVDLPKTPKSADPLPSQDLGTKYTGGFGGPAGFLGEQKEIGYAIKAKQAEAEKQPTTEDQPSQTTLKPQPETPKDSIIVSLVTGVNYESFPPYTQPDVSSKPSSPSNEPNEGQLSPFNNFKPTVVSSPKTTSKPSTTTTENPKALPTVSFGPISQATRTPQKPKNQTPNIAPAKTPDQPKTPPETLTFVNPFSNKFAIPQVPFEANPRFGVPETPPPVQTPNAFVPSESGPSDEPQFPNTNPFQVPIMLGPQPPFSNQATPTNLLPPSQFLQPPNLEFLPPVFDASEVPEQQNPDTQGPSNPSNQQSPFAPQGFPQLAPSIPTATGNRGQFEPIQNNAFGFPNFPSAIPAFPAIKGQAKPINQPNPFGPQKTPTVAPTLPAPPAIQAKPNYPQNVFVPQNNSPFPESPSLNPGQQNPNPFGPPSPLAPSFPTVPPLNQGKEKPIPQQHLFGPQNNFPPASPQFPHIPLENQDQQNPRTQSNPFSPQNGAPSFPVGTKNPSSRPNPFAQNPFFNQNPPAPSAPPSFSNVFPANPRPINPNTEGQYTGGFLGVGSNQPGVGIPPKKDQSFNTNFQQPPPTTQAKPGKYTGGFGGAPGVLGQQSAPGYAVQSDGSIKDPDHQYRPPKTPGIAAQPASPSLVAPILPPSPPVAPQPTPPAAVQPSHPQNQNTLVSHDQGEKYTSGFGGPPGILKPYDH